MMVYLHCQFDQTQNHVTQKGVCEVVPRLRTMAFGTQKMIPNTSEILLGIAKNFPDFSSNHPPVRKANPPFTLSCTPNTCRSLESA